MADNELPVSEHPEFRVMELVDVHVPLPATHAVVQLAEKESPFRTLSLSIGRAEGAALVAAQDRTLGVRPTTHELFSEVLGRVHTDVIAVRLIGEEGGVFSAELDTMTPRGREIFECRPSDGLILACRQHVAAPILCDASLLSNS